ncbi:MAG: glucoamylase family protein [Bacteroidota bacterium]
MHAGNLVGYFGNQDEARKAFRRLRRKGYTRAAWANKNVLGDVRIGDPFPRRRVFGVVAAFILSGAVASLVPLGREWTNPTGLGSMALDALVGGAIGALLSVALVRRSTVGVQRRLVADHARWLVPGESVLILQGAMETLRVPLALLLENSEVQPAVFILYPKRESPRGEDESPGTSSTAAQLQEHARRLASNHRSTLGPPSNDDLLRQIERDRRQVHEACLDLAAANRLEQSVSPTAEWLLDNEYIVEGNARKVLQNLPRRYYRQLPAFTSDPDRGLPRVFALARELVSRTDMRLDRENVLQFIAAYQSEVPLSISELWAVPQMLRTALMEGIRHIAGRTQTELRERATANVWANRLIAVNRRDPHRIFSLLAELAHTQSAPSPYFASQLIDYMYDEEGALAPVHSWCERTFQTSWSELGQRARNRQTRDQVSIGNAFTSLRQLDLLDWNPCFEELSRVEAVLRTDPAGVYSRMDFSTRDRCRRSIENLHRGSGLAEEAVARCAIDLAGHAAGRPVADEPASHVGTYLIGERRGELARMIGTREELRFRMLHWTYRHHSSVYFAGFGFFAVAAVSLLVPVGLHGETPQIQLLVALLLLIPASQISLEAVNFLLMRLLPPRTLPKMDYRVSGIPDAYRTLVVVPVMLVDLRTIQEEVEKLEMRYLANKEDNLLFGLLSDYVDATQVHGGTDESLLQAAKVSMEALNRRHGAHRFFLIHRERTWSESEQAFIGWERKRGKLEELNALITGTGGHQAGRLVQVGNPDHLSEVRFVITLDSDTQLPNGTARRLIETLSHPLNQAHLDGEGRIISGYTIIQPRVSPSLPSTSGSPFSRLFSDPIGIDPYTNAVSDVNQDLVGEGSYHGKGIYDVRVFSRMLAGRFPEAWILSHDLIEGAHVRVGLANDIELYDEFPQDYLSFVKRQHRWIRGDWQIAGWMMPRVPRPGGGKARNPLSWFDRGKIADNLRRSLLPIASVALLVTSWFLSVEAAWIAAAVVAVQLVFHSVAQPFAWATSPPGARGLSTAKLAHDLMRVMAEAALLPYQAWLASDAIARALYRRHISHRGLLEWTSAQVTRHKTRAAAPGLLLSLCLASFFGVMVGLQVQYWYPAHLMPAVPWLLLWVASPGIGWLLSRRPEAKQPQSLLREEERRFLRNVARRTWRYFSDFVNEESSWLPPDNYQVSYQNRLAMRTSPTNIGLWMVSVLGAHDFGYITVDEVVRTLTGTMDTMGRLDRHEGHLFNWYDIQTLTPLKPRYVSTVDSGNLLGALWSVDHGIGAFMDEDILDRRAFAGLRDTGEALCRAVEAEKVPGLDTRILHELLLTWQAPPSRTVDALGMLRRAKDGVRDLAVRTCASARAGGSAAYWARELERHVEAWIHLADRYLVWIEIMGEKTAEEVAVLDPSALPAFRNALDQAPSLRSLAEGSLAWIRSFEGLREHAPSNGSAFASWIDRVLKAFGESKWLAGEVLASSRRLAHAGRELSESMNMRFLYDGDRRLFSIGHNVTEGRVDHAYYDLLASEARLGSYVAIARGDVPAEHWFAMSRPYGAIGRRRVLLSWTGTMFEYLMPLLFQRSFANSLLDKAMREAVAIQIAYGRTHHVPWGISESASGDLDINKTYQYDAFGVPSLGLKRGLADRTVIAPYATLLAMSIAPREGLRNLARLAELGMLDDYGYFDALDFGRQPTRAGERGVIVRAYMAHHQGMGFLALNNLLHGNSTQNRFHGGLRARMAEPLLHERIPHIPPLNQISTRARISSIAAIGEVAPSVSHFETPHTSTPKTQLLCNGRYGLMVTNAGGGYSRWGDFDITRWQSDRTRDPWGLFCYIHDAGSPRLWCNTYQPTGGNVEDYSANFSLDRAVFRRLDNGIGSETEIIVPPEDDVEIRRMTFTNRSLRTCRLELTSYIELSLAPHNADRQHPAFNKLFIQTEAVPEEHALLAFRRLRHDGEPPIWVGHRFTLQHDNVEALRFETDRARFIGRGRTLAHPMGAVQEPGRSQGCVIDPILSLRHSVSVGPGERVTVSMILAAAATREQVLGLTGKYGSPHAIDRAMDSAWAAAQLELRLLRIQPDDARRFQQLASHLLYPNLLLRSPAERIAENRKGQAGLWAHGIPGDAPITLVAINEAQDLRFIRQLLQAHSYWRMHGLSTDLVILNEEAHGYERPLHKQLERLIQAHSVHTSADRSGGVFLRNVDALSPEDLTLLRAAARVVMVAARGSLAQQLGVSPEVPESPLPTGSKRDSRDPSAALPFMELPYFNSIGGFTPDGLEYSIYLGPGINTPMPWVNVIANPTFGTVISETGAGFTWQGNSQHNRLTQWSNDPVTDPASEALYIRDEETRAFWTPCASPIREDTPYRARHGAGYTVFEHNSHGIEQELTVFVPLDDKGGKPLKLQRLVLRNDSARTRKLSVTYYVEWTLGESRESSQMHVVTGWNEEVKALIARNPYNPDYANQVAFAATSLPTESYSGDRTSFLGRNRSMANPAAMERAGLSRRTGAGLDPCAALQSTVRLAPGEQIEITCLLGQGESLEEVRALILAYRDNAAARASLVRLKAWWNDRLGTIQVHTPELAVDFLINRWLLYQTLGCRVWARSALYQSGGAYGFRDQLQDVMALLYAHPLLARAHILLAASRQFTEGDVQHWWHMPHGAGIRSRVSDDLLWLPYVVAHYVNLTGDVSILHEIVGFLSAPALERERSESYQSPEISSERATLFEHCRRSVTRGQTAGPHGLPLMGTGDWNDSMNLVGAGGRGESVWLAWFLVDVLRGMEELSDSMGRPDLRLTYQQNRKALIERVEASAWDGEWYLRAIFDDGTPLGSSSNAEARIDSLPQSWAWLSGAADGDRAGKALESAYRHLVREDEGLVLLLEPPFDKTMPSPGYIKGYPPGVRENGGQYTHAAVWLAMAMARSGNGTRAAGMMRMLNPIEHARDPETVWRYGSEPYVVAADVHSLPGRIGQGGWSWYTGSAAWMYRAWVEELLGLHVRGETMRITPVIPGRWDGFQMSYRHDEATYEIRVENPDHCEQGILWVEMDGRRLNGEVIPLVRHLVKHRIVVRMGNPEP